MTDKQAQGAAVSYDESCLLWCHILQSAGEAAHPLNEFTQAFTTGVLQLRVPFYPRFDHFRITLGDLVEGQALNFAKVDLSQLGAGYNLSLVSGGNNLGGY